MPAVSHMCMFCNSLAPSISAFIPHKILLVFSCQRYLSFLEQPCNSWFYLKNPPIAHGFSNIPLPFCQCHPIQWWYIYISITDYHGNGIVLGVGEGWMCSLEAIRRPGSCSCLYNMRMMDRDRCQRQTWDKRRNAWKLKLFKKEEAAELFCFVILG